MPAGAFWRLQYDDDLDHRIQARADRQRFAQDRNVITAFTRYYEGSFLLEVQLVDDAESTFDNRLQELYNQQQYVQRSRSESSRVVTEFGSLPGTTPDSNRVVMDPQVRERIIGEYIQSSAGRQLLAQAMVAPIRRRLDYTSVARRTFLIDELPPGAFPIYDKDMVSDFSPPDWVDAGTWVKNGDSYAIIVATEPKNTERPPFSSAMVDYQVWRDYGPPKRLDAETFCKHWLPSEIPSEPRTRFERILMDDD
jgi:hypothetical protein